MLFLIDYDRKQGRVVKLRPFSEDQRQDADRARLELELLESHDPTKREIVIIEAENEEALRKSHARYFNDPSALISTVMTTTSTSSGTAVVTL